MSNWTITKEALDNKFTDKGLYGLGESFVKYGNEYGVNPAFLAAIAAFESGWGSSELATTQDNLTGISDSEHPSSYAAFRSKADCIKYTANLLAANYIGQGLTTFSAIGNKYAPVGDSRDVVGTNGSWASNVESIYRTLSGDKSSAPCLGNKNANIKSPKPSEYFIYSLSKTITTTSFKTSTETDWLLEPTDDERKYGINIYDGEQPLIKFSTAKAVSVNGGPLGALKKYSEFLYYLLNSEVSTAQVNCIGMPWIRPGFNVWYDPIHSDAIYYCTNVQHQGDPMNGGTTVLSLLLGRSREAFINDVDRFGSLKENSDNVFISDMKEEYRVSKFGGCLDTAEAFESVKNAAINYYGSPSFETTDAKDSGFHNQMYVVNADSSPIPSEIDKDKVFTGAYTKEQIESQLSSLYSKAPIVIKNRSDQLKKVVDSAREYMDKYHILEKHRSG